MTVAQIKEWNSLATDEVKIGQVLAVAAPAPGTSPVVPTVAATQAVPPATPAPVTTQASPAETVKISEGLSGASELKETGMAALLQGTEGNRKYLAQHPTIRPGTILKIRNLATNQEVFVRVTGPPVSADPAVMILISRSAYDRLGATGQNFRAELTYYK
jgi:LysM repeat protein